MKEVAERHKHILDAYLDGCSIYEEIDDELFNKIGIKEGYNSFIDVYSESVNYKAVPKSLENCYCEASDFNLDKLVKLGYTPFDNCAREQISYEDSFLYIGMEKWVSVCSSSTIGNMKKIKYSKQLKQWAYCPYAKSTTTSGINKMTKTLTIAEGASVQHKPQSTESVDVHLVPGTYVNICLPNGAIVTVHPDALYVYDNTETLLHTVGTNL